MKFIVILLLLLVVFSSLVLVSCSASTSTNTQSNYDSMSDEEVLDSALDSDFLVNDSFVELGDMV